MARASRRVVRRAVIAAALLLALLLGLIGWTAIVQRSAPPMLIVAHRGNVAEWPENTLEGIVSAAEMGPDGVEVDVQRSRDGTWYAFHSLEASEITDGAGVFTELSDEEIGRLRITGGLGYRADAHGTDLRVVSLSDVLEAMRAYPDVFVLLDVKPFDGPSYTDLVELLREEDYVGRVRVIARSLEGARATKAAAPEIRTSALSWVMKRPEDYPEVDAWLANANTELSWPFSVWSHPPGTVEAFANEADLGIEPRLLDRAHRWDVALFITNDLPGALQWSRSRD